MSKRTTPEEVIVNYFTTGATSAEVRVMFGVIKGLIKQNHASLIVGRKSAKPKNKAAKASAQTSFDPQAMAQ